MRLFTVYRKETSEALMHSKVIIPEGITEFYWLNKLLSALITTEGWNLIDNISSFGIIPTQDSNIVNTYETVKHLGRQLIAFVDGDAAGDTYVQHLSRQAQPPKFILQLPPGRVLEHVIAWILLPQNESEEQRIREIFEGASINYYDITELGNHLEQNFKTYWKMHDELIEIIITNPNCLVKVKGFIKAIDVIKENDDSHLPYWLELSKSETPPSTILRLSIFD
jgi:hypothetical protein